MLFNLRFFSNRKVQHQTKGKKLHMNLKELIRESLIFFHLDLTKNLKYDRLTKSIMKKNIEPGNNCIDIGCHKGEILNLILKYSPQGNHYAFEPIPYLYKDLKTNFGSRVQVLPYALSDTNGTTNFQLVKNAPAYSGIKIRKYDIADPEIEEIEVEMKRLDDIIPQDTAIDFMKIDVEGGEFSVLKGAKKTLIKNKPILLFECGKGASDYYGTKPEDLFSYLNSEIGLNVYTLDSFLKTKKAMSSEDFVNYFNSNDEYYFVAASK